MKKSLLILGIFLLGITRAFAQTDITNSDNVSSSFIIIETTYKGTVYTPIISLHDNALNKSLVQDTDYTVTYTLNGNPVSSILNAGSYDVTIQGIGNYTGTFPVYHTTVHQAALPNVTVSMNSSFPYTGSVIEPAISVMVGNVTIPATDYTIDYGTAKDVSTGGTVTLNPSASGNLSGTKSVTYTITPLDITTGTTITLNPTTYVYTGSAITPTIQSVTSNTLSLGSSDYTVNTPAPGNNTNIGNGTVNITGTGNFTGTASTEFTITAADLSTAVITLSPDSYVYTGSVITPTIQSVTLNGTPLTANTDYTVNTPVDGTNINAGTGTVSITGTGNYSGTASGDFTITQATLTDEMFTTIADKIYNGSPIALTNADITSSFNGKTLALDTDFTASGYLNNTGVGTATVTFTGTGNFTGEVNKTFTISAEGLTADMFTITDKTYTGSPVELEAADITGKDAEQQTLELGTDFDIQSYANNTNAGTASVVIVGKGDYSGTIPVDFTINAAALSEDMFQATGKVYTGSPIELTATDITAMFNTATLILGTDFTLGAYANNTNKGTASVTVTGKGNFQGDVQLDFTISPAPLTAGMFTIANKSFAGSAVTLESTDITAADGANNLVFGTDYTLGNYTNNTGVGTATVEITGAGNYTGTVPVNFTIGTSTLTASMFTAIADKPYTGTTVTLEAADITTDLVLGTDYTIGFYTNNVDAGTATVVFNGAGNYAGSTDPINFTITPVALTADMVTTSTQYYTGGVIKPQPTVKLGNVVLNNTNYTVSYPDTQSGAYVQPGTYNIQLDAVANGNLTGSATTTFQIVGVPETYHTVTLPEVEGITTDPVAGTYNVTEGDYFTFYIMIDDVESQGGLRAGIEPSENIIVKANGVEMNPLYMGNNRYEMTLTDIEEDQVIEIILKEEPPVSNINPNDGDVKVYSLDGVLYIETVQPATVNVIALNGQKKYQSQVNGLTSIPLTRGIYLVKVGAEVHKVIVQ